MAKIVLRSYQEENQRRRKLRAIYVFISIPLVAVILLFGFKTLTMFSNAGSSISSFQDKNFSESVKNAEKQKVVNIIEPWLAYYNSGTAKLGDQKFLEGIEDLKKALTLADGATPADCYIRANLAIGYEKQGDEYTKNKVLDKATGYYILGKQVIENASAECFPPNSNSGGDNQDNEAGKSMNDTGKRLDEKQGTGDQNTNGETTGKTDPTQTKTPEEQVKDRTDQTQKDREAKESQDRGKQGENTQGGGGESTAKPW